MRPLILETLAGIKISFILFKLVQKGPISFTLSPNITTLTFSLTEYSNGFKEFL